VTKRALFLLLFFCPFFLHPFAIAKSDAASASRPPLIPQPREFENRPDVKLAGGVWISASHADRDDAFAAKDLTDALAERGVREKASPSATHIYLLHDSEIAAKRILQHEGISLDEAAQPEGYVLVTGARAVYVIAHSSTGIFYGVQTVKQLVTQVGGEFALRGCKVRDWPAMRYRGVHDDLSRGPVPTLEFQKKQIHTFAAYKLNVYSPYFEHTMQYASNPLPGLPGGSMTRDEAKELVSYAAQYHVMIVPEQEAFGHLHHVLRWQQYAPLAEVQSGSVLTPGQQGSMQLITQWFDELASIYPAPFLHIGADETFELGRGQTSSDVNSRGLGAVYIDFLTKIHASLQPLHRRLLFWGDVAMNEPALVTKLPKDMIAVAWHYEPEPNGFVRWLDPYTRAGMETWVAPGVNNWNRVYPNNDVALGNIQGFVAAGQTAGSTGMLNTIWDDDGEGLFLEDWYGILFGAAASWQQGTSDIAQYQQSYGAVFHGDASGKVDEAQRALIAAHLVLKKAGLEDARNLYFWIDPWSVEGEKIGAKLLPVSEEVRTDAERALTLLAQARGTASLREQDALAAIELGARRIDFLAFRFQIANEMETKYRGIYQQQQNPDARRQINNTLLHISSANGLCQDLRDGYGYLRSTYQDVWLKENRPYFLNNVLAQYDMAMAQWIDRGNKFRDARTHWNELHTLPAPEEMGMQPAKSN